MHMRAWLWQKQPAWPLAQAHLLREGAEPFVEWVPASTARAGTLQRVARTTWWASTGACVA